MSDKVLNLLEAASAALSEATDIMKDSMLPLPASPISPSASDAEGYFFDESHYTDGNVHLKKFWSVPGNDEKGWFDNGHLAKVAVTTASYGVSIGPRTSLAPSALGLQEPTEDVRGPLGYCVVDKEKWSVAKDISVGDVFYMVDSTDHKVYRGTVTAQPVAGPFCPIRSLENSFVACLGLFSEVELRSEVQLVFKVDWKVHAHFDNEWAAFLEVVGEGVCRLPDE